MVSSALGALAFSAAVDTRATHFLWTVPSGTPQPGVSSVGATVSAIYFTSGLRRGRHAGSHTHAVISWLPQRARPGGQFPDRGPGVRFLSPHSSSACIRLRRGWGPGTCFNQITRTLLPNAKKTSQILLRWKKALFPQDLFSTLKMIPFNTLTHSQFYLKFSCNSTKPKLPSETQSS